MGFKKIEKGISTTHKLGWDYQLCAIEFEYHAFVLYIYIYISHVSMPTGKPCFRNTIGFVGHQLGPNTPHSKCGFTPKFANPKRPTTRHTCMALMHGLLYYCKPLPHHERKGQLRHAAPWIVVFANLTRSDDADDHKWKELFFNLKHKSTSKWLKKRSTKHKKKKQHKSRSHANNVGFFWNFKVPNLHTFGVDYYMDGSLSLVHSLFPSIHCMFGENRRLVIDEPVEFEKW
jgi:hypothetical protein